MGGSQPLIVPQPYCGISYTPAKEDLDKWLSDEHARYWKRTKKWCLLRILYLIHVLRGPWKMERRQINIIVRMFAEYCRMTKYLTNMRIENNPHCQKCDFHEETAHNILCECYALACLRNEYLRYHFLESEDFHDISCKLVYVFMNHGLLIKLLEWLEVYP